jgi:hypothetical protein
MSSIEKRFVALEAQMAELKAENELLKMQIPMAAITEGLKAASPADITAWMEACAAVAEKYGELKAPMPKVKKGKKASSSPSSDEEEKEKEKKPKKITNAAGPAEWNAFKQAVWHEMAAEHGITGEHNDAFKKAAAAAGITHDVARAEASRRKAEMEGEKEKKPKKEKAKKAEPATPAKKDKAAEAPAVPVKAKAEPKAAIAAMPAIDFDEAKCKADAESLGWVERNFNGVRCWLDVSGDVFSYNGEEIIGAYDETTEEFVPSE